MKTILATLCVLLALSQIGSCHPTKVAEQIVSATNICKIMPDVNAVDLIDELSQSIIPEDSKNARAFFGCFSIALKIQNKSGDFDFAKLSLVVQEMLNARMYTLDVDTQAQVIANSAIEHCKNTPIGKDLGLTALRMRNCLQNDIENSETYF